MDKDSQSKITQLIFQLKKECENDYDFLFHINKIEEKPGKLFSTVALWVIERELDEPSQPNAKKRKTEEPLENERLKELIDSLFDKEKKTRN